MISISVVEKCVFINPRGNHLLLQTNLDELIVVHTESGVQVIFTFDSNSLYFRLILENYWLGFQIYHKRIKLHRVEWDMSNRWCWNSTWYSFDSGHWWRSWCKCHSKVLVNIIQNYVHEADSKFNFVNCYWWRK